MFEILFYRSSRDSRIECRTIVGEEGVRVISSSILLLSVS